jgi:hypothetical protein
MTAQTAQSLFDQSENLKFTISELTSVVEGKQRLHEKKIKLNNSGQYLKREVPREDIRRAESGAAVTKIARKTEIQSLNSRSGESDSCLYGVT